MPKERTKKSRAHVQSASLSTRNLAAESGALEQIEIGAMADVSVRATFYCDSKGIVSELC